MPSETNVALPSSVSGRSSSVSGRTTDPRRSYHETALVPPLAFGLRGFAIGLVMTLLILGYLGMRFIPAPPHKPTESTSEPTPAPSQTPAPSPTPTLSSPETNFDRSSYTPISEREREMEGLAWNINMVGLYALVTLCMIWNFSPRLRLAWVTFFPRPPTRLPLVQAREVIAGLGVALLAFVPRIILEQTGVLRQASPFVLLSIGLTLAFLQEALFIAAVVLMSRRFYGRLGTRSLWPFWDRGIAPATRYRSMIVLGVGLWILTAWLLSEANRVNLRLVDYFELPHDENPLLTQVRSFGDPRVKLLFVLSAVVCAPILEELIFRGIFYNMLRLYMGVVPGAIACALIFAAVHGVKTNVLSITILALILTWLYEKTGSLIPGMICHAVNNAVTVALFFYSLDA